MINTYKTYKLTLKTKTLMFRKAMSKVILDLYFVCCHLSNLNKIKA